MIWNAVFIIIGILLFGYSYHLCRKEADNDSRRIYGTFAYAGAAIAMFVIYQIVFVYILHRFDYFELMIVISITEVIAHFLLNPGIERNKTKQI